MRTVYAPQRKKFVVFLKDRGNTLSMHSFRDLRGLCVICREIKVEIPDRVNTKARQSKCKWLHSGNYLPPTFMSYSAKNLAFDKSVVSSQQNVLITSAINLP